MNRRIFDTIALASALLTSALGQAEKLAIPLFRQVTFYDGYASPVSDAPGQDYLRLGNDRVARKISQLDLSQIGSDLRLSIRIQAACDNYDRIGSFNLALVPKDALSYQPEAVQRLELGRYITPFMNKNLKPDEVPYAFDLSHIASLLRDKELNKAYDFWAELELFGVPYAANTQVAGCKDRNDVFIGSASFETSGPAPLDTPVTVIPLNFRKNLNNYQVGASDELQKTIRTLTFHLDQPLVNASFHLITSNHGANAGGEEYNRRQHLISFDGKLIMDYKPGGISCEPFRVYNTQANGIYGSQPRTPAQWASFSNWCPGQAIPNRLFNLGTIPAGDHSLTIAVPDAVFVGADGQIPVSLFILGEKTP